MGRNIQSVTTSFYDNDLLVRTEYPSGTPLTTSQMKTASTYTDAGWSTDIWNIQDGSYPTLKWESLIKSE